MQCIYVCGVVHEECNNLYIKYVALGTAVARNSSESLSSWSNWQLLNETEYDVKNYSVYIYRGECYPPRPKARVGRIIFRGIQDPIRNGEII